MIVHARNPLLAGSLTIRLDVDYFDYPHPDVPRIATFF